MTYQYYFNEMGVITGKIYVPDQGFGAVGMPGTYVTDTRDLDPEQWQVNITTLHLEPRE